MEELKKYEAAAKMAGCSQEVEKWEQVIKSLKESGTKNIAVIGENNCGKTDLINKIAGTEIRKPTKLSMGEPPLKAVFQDGEEEEGYETVKGENQELKDMGIALYEIPVDAALDKEAGKTLPTLEKMDAAIYIVSALSPFTGSDMANLDIMLNKIPLVIYISKTDLIEEEGEYEEILSYIQGEFARRYEGIPCEFYDEKKGGGIQELIGFFNEIDKEELREFHILRIEQQVKMAVATVLESMLEDLEKEKNERKKQKEDAEDIAREEGLKWNDIRLTLMEKQQEAVDEVNKRVSREKYRIEKKLLEGMERAQNKKEWIKRDLKHALEDEMETSGNSVMDLVKDLAGAHTAWLVNHVSKELGRELSVEDMPYYKNIYEIKSGRYDKEFNNRKALAAAGSGVIAGGAILSGMPLIPTCIVAVPASLIMMACIKESREERQEYNDSMKKFVMDCCERNLENFRKNVNANISKYYEKILKDIMEMSDRKMVHVDFSDIDEKEAAVRDVLNGLN